MGPSEPTPASVVVLRREDGSVFLVRRPRGSRFFPNHYAFPGGGLEAEDGPDDEDASFARCAVRELEEEVTVRLDVDALTPAGVTVTPPFSPIRYRTQFFLADMPEGQAAVAQEPELAGGDWFRPDEALAAWDRGELRLPPPVAHVLEHVAHDGGKRLIEIGTDVHAFPITFARGLRAEPLAVGTLPPHTHTNAFVVGTTDLAVVDPGAPPPELDTLIEALDQWQRDGHRVRYVALTHHHGDHVGGLDAIMERFGCQLACSAATGSALGRRPDVELTDGAALELGDVELVPIETPGHAPGHLAFHVRGARAMLAGDLVAGTGTILVAPPEGDMAAYVASLERLADVCEAEGTRLLFPAHGPPAFEPAKLLRRTRDHRLEREALVLAAVAGTDGTEAAIARHAYEDTPGAPEALALLSTQAHLAKLEAEGRVVKGVEGWSAAQDS